MGPILEQFVALDECLHGLDALVHHIVAFHEADGRVEAGGRGGQQSDITKKTGGDILHDHVAVVEAGGLHEEGGQPAQVRVDQTFHVDLSELGNVHNGDGEGIAVELDGRRVPVRAHEGRAVGEKDRVIEHCVQLFHQRVIGLRSHALSRAVDVRDDAGVYAVLHAQRAGFVHDLAAAEDLAEEFRRFGGVHVVLELDETRVKGLVGAAQRLTHQGCAEVGVARRHNEIINGEQADADESARVGERGQTFAGLDAQRFDAVFLEHLRRGTGLAVHDEATLADVGHGDVGLVGKAADRALAGSVGVEAFVEEEADMLECLKTHGLPLLSGCARPRSHGCAGCFPEAAPSHLR